jgi:hypothetical protein
MLDLRSAGQLIGLILVARVLAYGIVRLIETLKPRSVHFIVTAALDREPETMVRENKPEGIVPPEEVGHCQHPDYAVIYKLIRKIVRYRQYWYCCCFGHFQLLRRHKMQTRLPFKLITEIIGLVTAGISLVILVLEYCFK